MPDTSVLVPYETPSQPFGSTVGQAAGYLADRATDAICFLYQNYPGYATGGNSGNPAAPANDGFLDDLCRPSNRLPPAPPAQPTGGQCVCRQYQVTYSVQFPGQPAPSVSTNTLVGPIGAITRTNTTTGGGAESVTIDFEYGNSACGGRRVFNITGGANRATTASIVSITPTDGGTDECGSLAPAYPVITPPANEINFNLPITISPNFTVNAPVTFFPPVFNFSPSLKIGDFNFDIGLGGLTISPSVNVNFPQPPSNQPAPPQPQPGDSPDDRNYDEILSRLLRLANRARLCLECDDDYEFLSSGLAGGRSGQLTVPADSIMVAAALILVDIPSNPKRETGIGQADVYYAGWAWFGGNENKADRLPIDAERKLFYAPRKPSPLNFSFTCRTGYTAQALITYKRLKSPLPSV